MTGKDDSNAVNNIDMSQHPFSHKIAFTYSATADNHTQPLELFSNVKFMNDHKLSCLSSTQTMKSSYTRKLPNLLILNIDSKTTKIF